MEVIQVVKCFGLCGGMEEYVFRLSHELNRLGFHVRVLCEIQLTEEEEGVEVIKFGESIKKPRWLSHILFSRKVSNWVKQNKKVNQVVHSHERISCHNVTTIHSTLFNFPKKGFPSFRKTINEYLEKREVSSRNLRKIVPVSSIIADEIKEKFPIYSNLLMDPVAPGVIEIKISKKSFNPDQPTIGFMGKEWKRKGLPKVIEIWRELKTRGINVKLLLAGFPKGENLGIKTYERCDIKIVGHISQKEDFFGEIDLLLHPARIEAYGMVVAEAMTLRVPVLCSNQCGAANDVINDHGQVLDYNCSDSEWANCATSILKAKRPEKAFQRTWGAVSLEYARIYQDLVKKKGGGTLKQNCDTG